MRTDIALSQMKERNLRSPRTPIADVTRVFNKALELRRQQREAIAELEKKIEKSEAEEQRIRDEIARLKKFYGERGEPFPDNDSTH